MFYASFRTSDKVCWTWKAFPRPHTINPTRTCKLIIYPSGLLLVDNNLRDRLGLVARTSHVQLTEGSDLFKWRLTKSGLFTVRSLYHHLIDTNPPFQHRKIWKMRIPLKIKIFLWFLQRGLSSLKTIGLGKIGKVARNVSVVTGMRISNTYSFTAPLLKRFGESSSSLQIWTNLDLLAICLVLGLIINLIIWKVWSGWA
jgi:hypothetical protein